MSLTPEERAKRAANCLLRSSLAERIAAAIREAVAEERKACANLCKIDILTTRGYFTPIEQAVLETAQEIEKSIRARFEKAPSDLPEEASVSPE